MLLDRSRRQSPTTRTRRKRECDPLVDHVLVTVDTVRVDPKEHRDAVAEPAGNLGRLDPGVQPERRGTVAQVLRDGARADNC